MKLKHFLPVILALSAVVFAGCGAGTPGTLSGPTTVWLRLTYQPDVQFAPFYVGLEKGIFSKHNIELNIQHIPESDVTKQVGTGEATFGVVSGEQVLLGRQAGLPVVYVFSWYQQYPVAIVSKADKGIDSPDALRGHSVGVPLKQGASYIALQGLLKAGGLTEADITLKETGFTQVQTLMSDQVDAVVVYSNNEPIQLAAQGVPINIIEASDVLNLVSNGIITNEQTIRDHPELVKAFDAAFTESLRYTLDNPDEAFELSKKHVEGLNDPAVAKTQREVLTRTLDMWDTDPLGVSQRGAWLDMQDLLLSMGLLTQQQNVEAAFTNAFIPPQQSQP